MDSISEYDLKQIKLIDKKIHLFETIKLELFDLINDLGGLIRAVEAVPEIWKNDFQDEINNLEIISDSIAEGSISRWKGNFKQDINDSVSTIKKKTAALIENYLKTVNPNISEIAIESNSNQLICPKCYEEWESISSQPMVICPKCDSLLYNPHSSYDKTSDDINI